MNEATYAALRDRLHAAAGEAPLRGTIELTHRCSLACQHCYNRVPSGAAELARGELSLDEYRRLLDEATAAGCLWLLVTGGEPLLRPDFADIWAVAAGHGLLLSLYTNATLVTPRIAELLSHHRPWRLEISVYGAEEASYDAFVQRPGGWRLFRRGLDRLLEVGLKPTLKTALTTATIGQRQAMADLAASLGLTYRTDGALIARLDGQGTAHGDLRLPVEEAAALVLADTGLRARFERLADHLANGQAPPPMEKLYVCRGASSAFAVDPYGGLMVCHAAQASRVDWRQLGFAEGWRRLSAAREAVLGATSPCRRCAARGLCSSCAPHAWAEHGDEHAPVAYFCAVTHCVMALLGRALPEHGPCGYC